jgi:hypothetical protein
MSENPLYFEFRVTDELINCTIIVTVFYAVAFLISSVILNQRKEKSSQRRGIEMQKLVTD